MYVISFIEDRKHDVATVSLLTDEYMQVVIRLNAKGKVRVWREDVDEEDDKKEMLFDDLSS